MSWLIHLEAGAEGRLCLATLLKVLLSLAGSGDQYKNLEVDASFFSVCMSYHREVLGVLTNWSLNSPAVSAFLDRYPFAMVKVQLLQFPAQPVKLDGYFPGRLGSGTGKRVVVH